MPRNQRKLPAKWERYAPMGVPVAGTSIVCFKTPLKVDLLNNKVDKENWFTTSHCLQLAVTQSGGRPLGFVVDLTATDRYYDPADFTGQGVGYAKLACYGHTVERQEDTVRQFMRLAAREEKRMADSGRLLGVHCTHGINRSGYLVCRYLIERKRWSFDDAVSAVSKARGYAMQRENYLQSLRDVAARPAAEHSDDDDAEAEEAAAKGETATGDDGKPAGVVDEEEERQREESERIKRKNEKRARKAEARRLLAQQQMQQQMAQLQQAFLAQQQRHKQIAELREQMRVLQERNDELERQRIAVIERQQLAERAAPRRRGRFRPVARDVEMEDISSSDDDNDEQQQQQQTLSQRNVELQQVDSEQAHVRQQMAAAQRHMEGLGAGEQHVVPTAGGAAPQPQQQQQQPGPSAAAVQQMMRRAVEMQQAMQAQAAAATGVQTKQHGAEDVSSDGDEDEEEAPSSAQPAVGGDEEPDDDEEEEHEEAGDPDAPQSQGAKRRARRKRLDEKWRVRKRGNMWEINAMEEDEERAQAVKVAKMVERQLGYAPPQQSQ